MKNSLILLVFFAAGMLGGVLLPDHINEFFAAFPPFILYALVLQVGVNIGSNEELPRMVRSLPPAAFALPVFTIVGTVVFSSLAGMLLPRWTTAECMAVGSGFAYYSLSSLLIMEFKAATVGMQVAAELAAIALLTNIIREMCSLLGAPLFRKYFGPYAPISVAGINSMDVCLPVIASTSGKEYVPLAIVHAIALEVCVPILVYWFCSI